MNRVSVNQTIYRWAARSCATCAWLCIRTCNLASNSGATRVTIVWPDPSTVTVLPSTIYSLYKLAQLSQLRVSRITIEWFRTKCFCVCLIMPLVSVINNCVSFYWFTGVRENSNSACNNLKTSMYIRFRQLVDYYNTWTTINSLTFQFSSMLLLLFFF